MDRCCRAHRSIRIVRGDHDVVRLGHRRDLHRFLDATVVAQVRLDDIDQLSFDEFPVSPLCECTFAGGDVH